MSNFPSKFSDQLLLEILSQTNTATAIHSTDDMIIETANDAMIAVWGKDRSVIGKPIEEALPELKGQPFLGMLQSVLHTGQTVSGRDTMAELMVNGELKPFYFDFEYRAIKNAAGQVICVLHTATDVTQRYLGRQRELELESELLAINEELASANEELATANDAMSAANEELAATNEELRATNEDLGEYQHGLLEVNNSLTESEARFRSMVTQAPVGICIIRAHDLMIQVANDAYLKLVGRQREELEDKTIWQAIPEADAYAPVMNQVITTGVAFVANEHELMLMRNGLPDNVFVNFVFEPLRDANGSVNAIMAIAIEVTEQVVARKKIEQSQNRLNSMVMTAPIGMTVIKSRDLIVEIANQPMFDIWNRTAEQIINKKLLDVFPELHDQPFPQLLQNVFDTGNRLAMPETAVAIAKPDGTLVNYMVDFAYDPLYDLNGNVEAVLATVINVTDKVLAREELQMAKDTLKQAIDSAEMGLWSADLKTGILTLSDQARKLHGIPADMLITLSESFKLITPEHAVRVKDAISNTVETKESFDMEYLLNPMDGAKPRWFKSTGKAYYDDNGDAENISGTIIDITETKVRDQQKDDFLSIASHELKTPVTSLKAALQLLDKMKNAPSPVMLPKLIEQSNRSMDKISTLIEDLLNLSRMNEGQLRLNKSRFNIAQLLEHCCSHVRAAGKHELLVQGDEHLEVIADDHRIDQVVVNMVNNAVKYAPNSKQIFLTVEKLEGMARISVRDTGPGIPSEKQLHLFERYYRTDAAGYQNSGLGLGLYISAEIVKKHGGEIGVDSEITKGSTFWFTLPL